MSDQPDRERIKRGLDELRPFIRYRASLESDLEQATLTLAAISTMLAGQTLDTAKTVLKGALDAYEQWLDRKAKEPS